MNDVIDRLRQLLKPNDSAVVAISGGPDSMCLIDILLKFDNINIIVAHVNHNVRSESKEEAKFVYNYCQENNLKYEYMKIDNPPKNNFEAFARKKRYEFFESLINKYKAKYLMTAHHGDDLMETILMKIVRGSSLKGYGGFSYLEDRDKYIIVRPLINKTKDEIVKYNEKNSIKYVVDKSNTSLLYTRNRYRHKILPNLKNENENVHLKFLEYSENIIRISNFIAKYSKNGLNNIYIDNKLKVDEFLKYDLVIQQEMIYQILERIYKNNIDVIKSIHVDNIINILNDNKPNLKIDLPLKMESVKSYNNFYIRKKEIKKEYKTIILTDKIIWNNKVIEIVDQSDLTDNFITYLNSKDIKLPLIVRTRKKGDKIKIKNMNHYKKVKDIFINEKIELNKRDNWPIVVDSDDNIVWIPGLKKSEFDRQKDKKYDIIIRYH